ncbi:agmatinase [Salegentibacter mishustinae]|uniref:Agmatinase n=1 Tax=Salegentibacter mishustinae TaxID=270918 RepID=A0A0Q9Z414_9FLAO|nr:agmatinase [Salegentibacter mishustinae]KRG27583.1 agmatinase [Salegentibacter mishustinae]PNW20360.1 agmatinase [Salegentibacter mishustinae]PZX63151.1 agmatinase [Salegentibacter mishustinae]GGW92178.1 agmatinase [Salegentibacter mishustinae]
MNKKNYAGIPDKYSRIDDAKVVLIPVPYDGTSTWQKGSDKGPEAFLEASENMELYDIETRSEVYKKGIYLAPPVTENSSPEKMVEAVYKTTKNYLKQEKFVTIFGGEHSVSIGTIRAFNESFEDLTVVQLDAHADLRPEYEGSSCNHACAVHEASKKTNLVQVGIRSMDVSEVEHMDENQVYFAHDLYEDWQDDAIGQMTPNVFITIDLDAFDPSILPSTGTPEPGGLFWYETLEFLKMMFKKKNVVGFDIVELCPNKNERSSDFLAAKLYYKMLSYKFKYQNYNEEDEDE